MVTKEEGMQVKTCKKKKKENNKNIFFFSSFRARSVYLPNSGQAGLRKSQATRLIVFPKIRYRTLASPFICAYFGDILEAAPGISQEGYRDPAILPALLCKMFSKENISGDDSSSSPQGLTL